MRTKSGLHSIIKFSQSRCMIYDGCGCGGAGDDDVMNSCGPSGSIFMTVMARPILIIPFL